jgi:hypothetical protein
MGEGQMKPDAKLLEALALLERGDWQQAHAIVQQHETQDAAWLHGIVHVLEGDLDNARYWYKRAKRTFSPDAKSELAAARRTLDA